MTENLKLEIFNKKNLSKQRELFRESFPETINTQVETLQHYDWKFDKFPYTPKSFEYVAYLDDKMVGYYAAIPYIYKIFETEYKVGMVCDVMTSIAARGKGVFTKLGSFSTNLMKESNLAFTTGYPIRKEVIPGHLKVGWEVVFNLPMYISFLKFDTFLRNKNLGFLSIVFNAVIKILSLFEKFFIKKDLGFEIKKYLVNDFVELDDFDKFISKWTIENKIALKKTKEFFKWRLNAPGSEYTIIALMRGSTIVGCAITRAVIQEKIPTLAILDYMLLEENLSLSTYLLYNIKKFALEKKIEFIICMMNPSIFKRYRFIKSIFIKSPYIFKLIIKRLNIDLNKDILYSETNWHLT